MKGFNKKAFEPIDQEEKDLIESIEREEWRSVKNINQDINNAVIAARQAVTE